MSVNQATDLVIYGLLVVGLSLVAHRIAHDFGSVMLFILLTAGLMIMLLGLLGLRGWSRRSWTIVTLILIAGLLIAQTVKAWVLVNSGVIDLKPVAVILPLLLFFAIMQLVDFVKAVGERPAQTTLNNGNTSKDTAVAGDAQNTSRPQLKG
jgi:hypothetical protein